MPGWMAALAKRLRLPPRSGFAELDTQIDKFRMLRDSYQSQSQNLYYDSRTDVNSDRKLLIL